jgi:proteasome lid subunit RPN8/RPN11
MKIRRDALNAIQEHARESHPSECCGILLYQGEGPDVVTSSIRAANTTTDDPARRYALGHKAHLEAVKMEAAGDAHIAGYYHSHPDGPPRPSQQDAKQAVNAMTYVIVGNHNGSIKTAAWRMTGGGFVEDPMECV